MGILARIQGHPDRAHLHRPLAASLGLPCEIMLHSSDPPDPWSGYRACLGEIPAWVSHLLVIQDDAVVCRNFSGAVEAISFSNPRFPVCLFLGGFPQGTARRFMRALLLKQPYVFLHRSPIVPLVAVLWPKEKAQEFLEWGLTAKTTRADDGNAGRWHRETDQDIKVCVPSLVEHPDLVPSVKGGQQARWGRDRNRVAVTVAEDGLAYQW